MDCFYKLIVNKTKAGRFVFSGSNICTLHEGARESEHPPDSTYRPLVFISSFILNVHLHIIDCARKVKISCDYKSDSPDSI